MSNRLKRDDVVMVNNLYALEVPKHLQLFEPGDVGVCRWAMYSAAIRDKSGRLEVVVFDEKNEYAYMFRERYLTVVGSVK